MKIELPIIPEGIQEAWPGEFEVFSWLSYAINLPGPLFMVTTLKENGLPNVMLSAWGMFAGTGAEPKFLMTVHNYTDTCLLLKDGGEFVVNFASLDEKARLFRTKEHYPDDIDEITASGFTPELAAAVRPPRIKEAFGHFECVVEWTRDVEEHAKRSTLIMGKIVAAAMDEAYMTGAPREAFGKRRMPYFVAEYYDHATRSVTVDGWTTTLDLSPLGRSAAAPGLACFELLVDRYAECFRFYRDVIGWPVKWGDEQSGFAGFAAGETTLALYGRDAMRAVLGAGDRPDRAVIILAPDSVDRLYADMTARGAKPIIPPQSRPEWGVRNAYLRDPDGNVIAMREPVGK